MWPRHYRASLCSDAAARTVQLVRQASPWTSGCSKFYWPTSDAQKASDFSTTGLTRLIFWQCLSRRPVGSLVSQSLHSQMPVRNYLRDIA